jgi:hypothetical protein
MIDQAGNPEPRGPGEIGWPANSDKPFDPSIPPKGAGGATAHVPEPADGPTLRDMPVADPKVEVVTKKKRRR